MNCRISTATGASLRVFITLLAFPLVTAQAASFQGLGFLPTNGTSSWASGVSADGSVVVGYSEPAPVYEQAFRWSHSDGMQGLGVLVNGYYSLATGVSGDGATVVGYGSTSSGYRAFSWTSSGGLTNLGVLPGASYSYAWGSSANGSVIVGWSGTSVTSEEAFRWSPTTGMVGLGKLTGAASSWAAGTSADGSVVVGNSGGQVFRWTSGGGMVGIGGTHAGGISMDGATVVGDDNGQAFRWTAAAGGLADLGFLPGFNSGSSSLAVSGDGSIVVGYCVSQSAHQEAFIWDAAHGMRSLQSVAQADYGLNLTGWTLSAADAISSAGQTIVGYGTDPNGRTEAWLLQVPEPGTCVLWVVGVLSWWGRKRGGGNSGRRQ